VPVQHIDASAALDSGLSAARIARHLLLRFSSPKESKSLGNFELPIARQIDGEFYRNARETLKGDGI
jgi:hypothetical protein